MKKTGQKVRVKINLIQTRKKVNDLLSDLRTATQVCITENQKLREAEDNLTYIEEARSIAQQIAQEIQQQAHQQIAGVVSSCLETVFDGDDIYGFKIRFDRKRGRTEAVLILTKNGYEVEDPLNADSGGVVDIAAFALRTSCIILAKPRLRKFLAMDEPFKFVSEEFRRNVRLLLEGMAKEFEFQYLMVTHINELKIGKVIEL